ncbi:rab GTPase-binding effector protein 1-like isoform X2 [Xenia sp. Carnegie-2017]|uniref:rab GTPase-binding effector protein 1-like isoform X2 n=1 Tax=Xenia sp. Carnegie-2017 TaxID=2897299 RepID=UPI001F043C6E|nr:rab GTPase-binding effector protein 1-like isoform X2 [Xenia sp. Carnegie-2017]
MDDENVDFLKAKVKELEIQQNELRLSIESKEAEFGKKRAQLKDLFLQKETQLHDEATKLRIAREENSKLLANLQNLSAERDDLKTAVVIAETSSNDKIAAIDIKYQEEIASLKAIMHDAVQETRQEVAEKFTEDKRKLVAANHELEKKLAKFQTLIHDTKSRQHQQPQEDTDEGLFDVLPRKPQGGPPEPTGDGNLEDSMKKAQEDAEALRSIVMPLEEEIASLKSKLKTANEKITLLEEKKQELNVVTSPENLRENVTDSFEDKIKDLTQYLEAERSARTDLEMFVAVLNTQKAVLQEDADKLRKELHNVCRILEQEKEEHSALKSTWEMANDRFLETQRVQRLKMDKMINLLSSEHRQLFEEEVSQSKETVELLKPPSPATSRKFINRKTNKQFVGSRKQELSRVNKSSTSEHKRSLASFVARKSNSSSSIGPSILDSDVPQFESNTEPLMPSLQLPMKSSNENINLDSKSLNSFSDEETSNGSTMKKYKSAEDIEIGSYTGGTGARSRSQELKVTNDISGKPERESIDWKNFQEAAKTSLSNDVNRTCAMCKNYEKQLQNLQLRKEELTEETNTLSKKLKDEQEAVIMVNRALSDLEETVKVASEDAQSQIKAAMETQRSFESLLEEITADIDKTKRKTSDDLNELMLSRDIAPTKGNALERDKDNIVEREAVLQSEIDFMKDRVMAEQFAKDRMEELYQAEIESLGEEIKNLKSQLAIQSNSKGDLCAAPVSSKDVKLESEAAQTHKDNVVYDTSSVASTADTCMDNIETNGITK